MEEPDTRLSRLIDGYQGGVGIYGLYRLVTVIDGKEGFVYTRASTDKSILYEYNRLGAVFTESDRTSDHLVATVVENSPAHRYGIRNGDILKQIDDLDVTKWRSDPKVNPLSRFWAQPAGTRIRLTLERNGRRFETTVVLSDLLDQQRNAPDR